jgi:hypothetical protein
VRQSRQHGSVRGAAGNRCPYRDRVAKTLRVPEWQVNQAILVNIARMPKAACSRAKKMHAAAANGPSALSISSVQRMQASRELSSLLA